MGMALLFRDVFSFLLEFKNRYACFYYKRTNSFFVLRSCVWVWLRTKSLQVSAATTCRSCARCTALANRSDRDGNGNASRSLGHCMEINIKTKTTEHSDKPGEGRKTVISQPEIMWHSCRKNSTVSQKQKEEACMMPRIVKATQWLQSIKDTKYA